MSQPLVSVIITTYNRAHLVCRAIDSVLAQTYKNIEIIVVDDCSIDATSHLISNYGNSVKYLRNIYNMGVSASRNLGIKTSNGDFVCFLDDDDELFPDKIEKQIELFRKNSAIGVVYCGSVKKNDSETAPHPPILKGKIFPSVLKGCPNAIHTLLVKRECFLEIGFFDESLSFYEDLDIWIRLAKKFVFDFVDENLVSYNIHGVQTSVMVEQRIVGTEAIIQKYSSDFLCNPYLLYGHLRRLASRYALIGNYEMFYNYIGRALYLKPWSIGCYAHLILATISTSLHKKIICKCGLKKIGDVALV